MTVELCHAGILELGCLIDLGWIQTSAWLTTALPSRRPTHAITDDGLVERVRAAADQLPVEQAHALWLVDVCGATYAEGATEIGVTPTAFASRVHSARDAIRRTLT
jgi:DNA-directed RNA polymerase specialized sigma24 family protein